MIFYVLEYGILVEPCMESDYENGTGYISVNLHCLYQRVCISKDKYAKGVSTAGTTIKPIHHIQQ